MAEANVAGSHVEHPAPARHQADIGTLAFGLLGAPVIWGVHFLANVTIASRVCSVLAPIKPSITARASVLAIDAIAFVIAITAFSLSMQAWRQTRHEGQDRQESGGSTAEEAAHVGEGRTRFMALGGIILSATFTVAILFDTVAALMVSSCGK